MLRFLLKSLFLNSLLALLAVSCSPVTGYKLMGTSVTHETRIRPIISKKGLLLYKAKIKIYRHAFSGMVVLKQTDSTTAHFTFLTEIGLKMFDFEIQNGNFRLTYIFEPLNKPAVIRLLEADMKLVLLQQLLGETAAVYEKKEQLFYKIKDNYTYYYQVNKNSEAVEKIIKKGQLFKKVKINYFYKDSLFTSRIMLKHYGLIRLKIELNTLDQKRIILSE